eukprot:1155097-Pelagomonas_calceolata.AAC.2
MVHACTYNCLAVLSLAAAVCVDPGFPICNFELEGELFAFPYSGHNGVPRITDGKYPWLNLGARALVVQVDSCSCIPDCNNCKSQMEIPENVDEREFCWAPKRMPRGSEL